jgi:rod shape-determining protein MreD
VKPVLRLGGRYDVRLRKRINRAPSPVFAYVAPWASIMLGSLVTGWLTIASTPIVPPLGFLLLVGWRQLRPGLLPVWAGMPLGLFDDLVSGQPMGSAILLWSVASIVIEVIETRWPWRNFAIEWAIAAALIAADIVLAGLIASGLAHPEWLLALLPQLGLALLGYPLAARLCARLDRYRLLPFRVID